MRAAYVGGGTFRFLNTNRFRPSGYLKTTCEIYVDGALAGTADVSRDIAPLASADVTLDLPQTKGDVFVNFIYTDGGHTVAVEQIAVRQAPVASAVYEFGEVMAEESEKYVTFRFDGGQAQFCKTCGALRSYTKDGVSLLNEQPVGKRGFRLNLYRALLDNDAHPRGKWRWDGRLHHMACTFTGLTFSGPTARAAYTVSGGSEKLFELTLSYTVHAKGTVEVEAKLLPCSGNAVVEDLPRFGLTVELPEQMRNVTYYGAGVYENLPDFKAQSPVGVYKASVDDMQEPYIKPQDNGNHGKTRYVKLTDGRGAGLRFAALDKHFSFNVRPFTQALLCEAKHREDLHDEHTTVLNIDGFIRGTGTSSCGQDTLPQYRVNAKNGLSFRFCFMPALPEKE